MFSLFFVLFICWVNDRLPQLGDIKYWHKPIDESETKNPWFGQPNSVNVEMTAYGLLAYIEAGHATESLPIVKWLISQQNDMGGFLSTQDTVVGLMALAKFAQRLPAGGSNIDVVFKYNDSAETKLTVNPGNSLVLQSYEVCKQVLFSFIQYSFFDSIKCVICVRNEK